MSHANFKLAQEAIEVKGWWQSHRFLALRRLSQITILLLFLVGPWFGWWLVKGNLNYSLTLGVLPLADPLVLLQSLLARHVPERNAVIGVVLVLLFYGLVGGRVFCSWVCPVNLVTDAANALRRRLDIRGGADLAARNPLLDFGAGAAAGSHHRRHCVGTREPGVDAPTRPDVWHGCWLAVDWRHLPV
jgi:hypothetical protein